MRHAQFTYRIPRLIGVVVPAHDEEGSIDACIDAIEIASTHEALAGIDIRPIVVLDRCSDTTGERASDRRHPFRRRIRVIETFRANVGAARRKGFATALGLAAGLPHEAVWLATTDADTLVPHDWLARQLWWRRRGADAVAGTVKISDWAGQPTSVNRRWTAHVTDRGVATGHPHVHGANLALSAAAYLRAGGMPAIPTAEDHAMWQALQSSGARTVSVGDMAVDTSARRDGRAPDGFATLLRSLGSRQHR